MVIFLLANQQKHNIMLPYGPRLLCGFLQAAGYEPAACSFYVPAAAGSGLIPATLLVELVTNSYKLPLRLIPATLLLVAFDAVLLTQHRQRNDQPLPLAQQQQHIKGQRASDANECTAMPSRSRFDGVNLLIGQRWM